MDNKLIYLAITFILLMLRASYPANGSSPVSDSFPQEIKPLVKTITEPVKIVKIELATNTIVVSNSEIHTYVVDPQYIDLKQFRIGTQVTATLKVTTTTDRMTLAKTSRTQLVKLQK